MHTAVRVNGLPKKAIDTEAISGSLWQSGLFVAIQGRAEQFADWSHLTEAVRRRFEYNLIPFPPTLQNRVCSISANFAGTDETCERGKEAEIINQ